ncbi:ABC transporter ATP-binding protein [Sodalis sp. RH15]|uniref:ABC transporter ATP-binding protein n=1 Tax=Sodalis sp. RH15 TaxID=3394330 RepID=UPI0039B59E59
MNPSLQPLLSVNDLTIAFSADPLKPAMVEGLSFTLHAGETLAIVGESGSGKSVSMMSLMQLLPKHSTFIRAGEARFNGQDLLCMNERQINQVRGAQISMIFQEPMTSLNPVLSIGLQLTETIIVHQKLSPAQAKERALAMLDRVRINDPQRRFRQYPHEMSGGMRQRVMIAMALACRPQILIADEPTTALDVTIQAEVLELLRELKREFHTSIILITHDMGVVAEMADRVIVMQQGRMVEQNTVRGLFAAPQHAYTRALMRAVPRLGESRGAEGPVRFRLLGEDEDETPPIVASGPMPSPRPPQPLLEVKDLHVRYDVREGLLRRLTGRVHAVEGVSFVIYPGETLALVGESGCGKSTTGRSLIGLEKPAAGDIWLDGYEVTRLDRHGMQPVRKLVQMVFQDPLASLNPRLDAGSQVREPMDIHRVGSTAERDAQVSELFRRVGLAPEMSRRFPHEFSGGQRQRLCIARALSLRPRLIVADEAVSALDVSIQAQVVNLMLELQAELGIAWLFISHDMAVVERVAHRVAVMQMGRIVEIGPKASVFARPGHPYTQRLIAAVPVADPGHQRTNRFSGATELKSPIRALDHQMQAQSMKEIAPGHFIAIDA